MNRSVLLKIKYICVSIAAVVVMLTLILTGCSKVKEETNTSAVIEQADYVNESDKISHETDTDTQNEDSGISTDENALAEGEYEVYLSLAGGSGRASITSPAKAEYTNGEIILTIEWSSPNYDYMIVNGKKYLPVNEEGNSVFNIPAASLECSMEVTADTVAMGTPHEIEYVITVSQDAETAVYADYSETSEGNEEVSNWLKNHAVTGKMDLKYAEKFGVMYLDDKYCVVSINGTDYYLITDDKTDNNDIPEDLPDCVSILHKSMNNIYVVSTSSMDYFITLDELDKVAFTSFEKKDVKNEKLVKCMDLGEIEYAGKYSAPDYELILSKGCNLVVENTMITHAPGVLEQLHKLKINTMIDYSSHEDTPYGRMEWIKLYGLLCGCEEKAEKIFSDKEKALSGLYHKSEKTVAYFYITESGSVVVRKNQDYIPKLINIAGGEYIFDGDSDYDGTGTMSIQKEDFFEEVMDCDYLIYCSTISGAINSIDELISKCAVLKNTKAYREGNIFCTTDNIYLSVMEMPEIAQDINGAINGEKTEKYLYRLY